MIRRQFTLASVLSLLLCGGTIVMWAGSYIRDGAIELASGDIVYEVRASRGLLTAGNAPQLRMEQAILKQRRDARARAIQRVLHAADRAPEPTELPAGDPLQHSDEDLRQALLRAERRAAATQADLDAQVSVYRIDHMDWPPVTATPPYSFSCRCRTMCAISAVPWLAITLPGAAARLRSLRRRKRGLCQICGYDLRASKERCPECGKPRTGAPSLVMVTIEKWPKPKQNPRAISAAAS